MTSTRKILVTGGAGFIGSHTVDQLLAQGMPVRVLDNLSSGRRSNLPNAHPLLEFRQGDIRDPVAVAEAMDGVSHVLHLAAQVSVARSLEAPGESCQHNLLGFVNVLDAARRAGVERLVYASSAAVYGEPAYLPLDEAAPTRPLSPYGLEKLTNEAYAALYTHIHGLSCLGLRYFNVYGPRQDPASPYAGVISIFVERAQARLPLYIHDDGLQNRDFVCVPDVARVNADALLSDAQGVCNVATGRSVTLLDLVGTLEKILGYTLERRHLPPRQGDIRDSGATGERMRACFGLERTIALDEGLGILLSGSSAAA
ncbi:MAG: NAD-dependent epimerase/dehydratase family protein [Pseudomonadota bacterium]